MKWFFFLLLLANIGLFIWIYPQLSEPEVGAGLPEDVNGLTLLSEVNKVSDGLPDKTKNDSEKEEISRFAYQRRRFDLCSSCHREYVKNPLGMDATANLGFSEN